jgi:hypothetical protein
VCWFLVCRASLVPSFAQGDQPVRAVGVQVGLAVVAGVGQHGADDVIGGPGDGVQAFGCIPVRRASSG